MSRKPTTETIPKRLSAASFEDLQRMMLALNQKQNQWHNFQVQKPVFEGDSWDAIYYDEFITEESFKRKEG